MVVVSIGFIHIVVICATPRVALLIFTAEQNVSVDVYVHRNMPNRIWLAALVCPLIHRSANGIGYGDTEFMLDTFFLLFEFCLHLNVKCFSLLF